MKIFLDECVDWRMSREIVGHEVSTARQMGWSGLENGELLALVSRQFEVFLTVDRNLSYQQNLGSLTISIVVLEARTNRLAELRLLIPKLLVALRSISPGVTVIK